MNHRRIGFMLDLLLLALSMTLAVLVRQPFIMLGGALLVMGYGLLEDHWCRH